MDHSKLIIITAPHAYCTPGSKVRMCDTFAEDAALEIYACLLERGHSVELLLSDTIRSVSDLNRIESRTTTYRQRLSGLLKSHTGVLLDIHSFPRGEFDITFSSGEIHKSGDVVVLDIAPGTAYSEELTSRLSEVIHTTLLEGSQVNDVVTQSRQKGWTSTLIEFVESFPRAKLKRVAAVVAEWAIDV